MDNAKGWRGKGGQAVKGQGVKRTERRTEEASGLRACANGPEPDLEGRGQLGLCRPPTRSPARDDVQRLRRGLVVGHALGHELQENPPEGLLRRRLGGRGRASGLIGRAGQRRAGLWLRGSGLPRWRDELWLHSGAPWQRRGGLSRGLRDRRGGGGCGKLGRRTAV